MITVTRPVHALQAPRAEYMAARPLPGGAPVVTIPLPVVIPGNQPYAGMDPSNQATWVRPFNPADGMIAYLNFNGAAMQDRTPTGGLQRGKHQRNLGYTMLGRG